MHIKSSANDAARVMLLITLVAGLTGCVTPFTKQNLPTCKPAVSGADARTAAAGHDTGMNLLGQAPQAEPSKQAPWARIAQRRFDEGHYKDAIAIAQRALACDPADTSASAFITLAKLQIADELLALEDGSGSGSDTAPVAVPEPADAEMQESRELSDTLAAPVKALPTTEHVSSRGTQRPQQQRTEARATNAVQPPAKRPTIPPSRRPIVADPFWNIGN